MHTTNDRAGVTHIWPYNKLFNPDAQPFSGESDSDVWAELRDLTLDDDVRGNIVVATHVADLRVSKEIVIEEFLKGDVVYSRIKFVQPREVEWNVYRPARSAHHFELCDGLTGAIENKDDYPAMPARNEVVKKSIAWNLGSKADAEYVVATHRKREISALVLWEPDGDEHLKYIDQVVKDCPDLPIYIFHNECRAEKYGVERESGASWQHRFHTKTEALTLPEVVDVVVRGLCNVGSISMWSALPKHGKSYLFLSIMKALLSGEPWLNHFEVSKAKRVVYLVPEVGLRGVMKRLAQVADGRPPL